MAFAILRGGFRFAKSSLLTSSIRRKATEIHAVDAAASDSVSWDDARPYEEIPGPKPLPIIGNLHQFIPGIGEMGDADLLVQHKRLIDKYGKIVKISKIPGRRDIVFLFDPKMFEQTFRNEGPWPERDFLQSLAYYRKLNRKEFYKGVGGIMVDLGEEWKRFRTKVNPPMMQPRIANMYLQPIVEVSNDFIERTKALRDSKNELPADYINEINKWALESIAMVALDKRLGCLEPNLKPDSEPQKMIHAVEDFFSTLEVLEMRTPLWKIISTPTWRKYAKSLDFFTDVAMKYINDAIKRMQERKPGADYDPSVLERILLRDPDPTTACIMATDMLIAGVDTTSHNVASMMYLLSKNQDKQQELYKETVKFLPNRNDEITVEMIEDMKYLKAGIKETMRLLGISVIIMRSTVKDTVIGNYRIPKQVNVIMAHLILARMDEYYPLASQYIPERWLKSPPGDGLDSIGSSEDYKNVRKFKTNPFSFLPFGFGPRMCIGKRFAEMELIVLMTKLSMAFVVLRGGFRFAKSSLLPCSIRRKAKAVHTVAAEESDSVGWDDARPYEEIPGPKPLPIIGNLHQFIPGIGEMGDTDLLAQHKRLMNKYGKIVKISKIPGRRDIIFLFDPKMFEEVYRKEGPMPERDFLQSLTYFRKVHKKEFYQGVGGVMVDSGEEWKKFRTKVNPPMLQPRIANMCLQSITEVANDFIERTKALRDSKSEMPADYINEINKWALESISMIALEKRLGCLEPNLKPDSEPQKMIHAVEDFFACTGILELRPPLWKIISTPTWRKYTKAMDYFTDVAMKNINDAIKRMQERKPGADYEPSVLERILLRDPHPRTACIMATDMLIAGVDTTAIIVANMMNLLSKNQDKQQELYKETVKFLPNRNDEITVEMIEDMYYLKASIKETMRLLGIIPMSIRGTVKDTVIGNYRIPKNVTIMMAHMVLGRMNEQYPLASQFIPERWLKSRPGDGPDSFGSAEDYDNVKVFKSHPFMFLPFGFGPRMCIGKRFADMELNVLMTKIFRNFKVEYNYGEIEYACKLLHVPISPLKYKLTDREG